MRSFKGVADLFGPQHKFQRFGKGEPKLRALPQMGVSRTMPAIRSMWTEQSIRSGAHGDEHGSIIAGDRAWTWVLLRLGAETGSAGLRVLLSQGLGAGAADRGGSGRPESAKPFQGVKLNSIGDPWLYIQNPTASARQSRRARSIPSTR